MDDTPHYSTKNSCFSSSFLSLEISRARSLSWLLRGMILFQGKWVHYTNDILYTDMSIGTKSNKKVGTKVDHGPLSKKNMEIVHTFVRICKSCTPFLVGYLYFYCCFVGSFGLVGFIQYVLLLYLPTYMYSTKTYYIFLYKYIYIYIIYNGYMLYI